MDDLLAQLALRRALQTKEAVASSHAINLRDSDMETSLTHVAESLRNEPGPLAAATMDIQAAVALMLKPHLAKHGIQLSGIIGSTLILRGPNWSPPKESCDNHIDDDDDVVEEQPLEQDPDDGYGSDDSGQPGRMRNDDAPLPVEVLGEPEPYVVPH